MSILHAGFDVNIQAARAALNRTIDGSLAALLAAGTTRFTFPLPTFRLGFVSLALGALAVEVKSGEITALRPVGATHHGVEADFDVTGPLAVTGMLLTLNIFGLRIPIPLGTLSADLSVQFRGVDLDVDVTAHGMPSALVLGLTRANLAGLSAANVLPRVLGPLLQGLLSLLRIVLQAGFSLAAALVPRISIMVKPMIDAFSLLGIKLHQTSQKATSSPFITALGAAPGEVLVVATDFQRVNPPPAGDPSQLAPLPSPGSNVAVTLNSGVINQGVELAMALGYIPRAFPGGGFTFHVRWISVNLLGDQAAAAWASRGGFSASRFTNPATGSPLGAIQVTGELRAKRGGCWCGVKVRIFMDAVAWPYVEVPNPLTPPSTPGGTVLRQHGVHLRLYFDATATVNVSGYLVMLLDILFGPILVPLLFLVSQAANVAITTLLPYTRTINPGGPLAFTLTANSAAVNAFITFALDFNVAATVSGQGSLLLDHFTGYRLVDDATYNALPVPTQNRVDVKVDYGADSISIEDGVIRLSAELRR